MKKIINTLTTPMAVAATAAVLTLLSTGSTKAANPYYDFTGATSSDPTVGTNYNDSGITPATTAPSFPNATTTDNLYLDSSTGGNGFIYSAAQGTSTFGDLYSGVSAASTTDEITGGTVNFGAAGADGFSNVLGFTATSALTVTGGTVNFLGTGFSGDNNSLELSFQGNSALNVSGGLVTTTAGLALGWYKDAATINLSGGTIDLLGTSGTKLNSLGGGATGSLNFLAGNGVYEETASAVFASGIKVNFATGSGGLFEVAALNDATFSALATAGSLSYGTLALDNTSTDANYYLNYLTETQNAGVETLAVTTAAPEPSTWALMLGGLGVLVFIQRKRLSNV